MQINIAGHGIDITPAIRNYATEKLERLLKKRGNGTTSVNVILGVEKLNQIAKATLHFAGADIHAESKESDLYSAIDLLIDKLDHQLTKHKDRLKDHHREQLPEQESESEQDEY